MTTRDGLKYTKEHEWVRVEGATATIGITHYAQGELGDIVYVTLPAVGADLRHMAVFGTVEAVKTVADLFSPVTGKVVAVNAALADSPDLVNRAPYDDGWMVKVEMAKPAETGELLSPEAYKQLIGE